MLMSGSLTSQVGRGYQQKIRFLKTYKMKKRMLFWIIAIGIVALLSAGIAVTDYFPLFITRAANFSAEKIINVGAEPAVNMVFDFISERELEEKNGDWDDRNIHSMFMDPYYITALGRQEVMFQNLKKAFRGNRENYDGVAYASWTANYSWDYYTNNAPKNLREPMISAYDHILQTGKQYLADTDNLSKVIDGLRPLLKKRFEESSEETKIQVLQNLNAVANYNGSIKDDYDYIGKFLERRRAEGGEQLVNMYKIKATQIIEDLQ